VHVRAVYTPQTSPWMPYFESLNPDKGGASTDNIPEEFARELPGEKVRLRFRVASSLFCLSPFNFHPGCPPL